MIGNAYQTVNDYLHHYQTVWSVNGAVYQTADNDVYQTIQRVNDGIYQIIGCE